MGAKQTPGRRRHRTPRIRNQNQMSDSLVDLNNFVNEYVDTL